MHILPELALGGAEMVMLNLISGTSKKFCHEVVTCHLLDKWLLHEIESCGAGVVLLPSFRNQPLKFLLHLRSLVCKRKPQIIHAWMYHANLASVVVPRSTQVIWSFHAESLSARLLPLMAGLSLIPASYIVPSGIVFPSFASLAGHRKVGFNRKVMRVIHNPVNTEKFFPDIRGGANYRMRHSYPSGVIIGCAARWHSNKGHLHLFDSLRKALDHGCNVTLACVGNSVRDGNEEIESAIRFRGLNNRVILLGQENDMRGFFNSVSLLIIPSHNESFGNVIIEAYACGVPVLSTACGGPSEIIFSDDCLVPVGDSNALSAAIFRFVVGLWKPSTEGLVEYANRFSSKIACEKYAALYSGLR